MAMRLNSLSLQKKFSIRWRHLYISASIWSGVARRGCCAITTLAPRSLRSAMISLLSKAVSAIKAPNSRPSISGATPTVSKRCPGSRTKRTRLPRASVRPESWSSCRPWSGQWPGSQSPFCALSVAVDLDDGGVNHSVLHVRFSRGGIKKPLENIGFHPVAIPLEDGVPAPECGRQVAPGAASSRDPQHRLDKPAVIRTAPPGVRLLPPAMRLHFRPLGVRQHKSVHRKLKARSPDPKKIILNRP